MATATPTTPDEVTILARVLGKDEGKLSLAMAKHILTLGFSEHDKARMHDLAILNQDEGLTESEKNELFAFTKVGTLISILKSRARLVVARNVKNGKS